LAVCFEASSLASAHMLSQKVDSIDVFLSHASCQHFKFCFVAASTGTLYIEASICIIKCLKSIMGDSGCLLTIGHLSFQGLGDFTLDETTHFADGLQLPRIVHRVLAGERPDMYSSHHPGAARRVVDSVFWSHCVS